MQIFSSDYETVGTGTGFTASVVIGQLNGDVGDALFTGGPGSELRSVRTSIGFAEVATGIATVDGAGFNWTNSSTLRVGENGNGTLNIQNGAIVSSLGGSVGQNSGSIGSVTITGDGSRWNINPNTLFVGSSGTGAINIQNGGTVNSGFGSVGTLSTAFGEAIVDGVGSNWTIGSTLAVGSFGIGTLNIQNGGLVSCIAGSMGGGSSGFGDVTIDGSGSIWLDAASTNIGSSGAGSFTIQSGGFASSLNGYIGRNVGGLGVAIVTGADAQWAVENNLSIGGNADNGTNGGTGALTINAGGSVVVGNDSVLFPNGTLNLNDGSFTSDSVSFIGGGSFNFNSGTLHVGTYIGNLVNEAGTLAPGQSAGSTTIFGSYTQEEDASLEIEIGGPGVGTQFDFVNVTGNVFLDGQLQLALINGFVPSGAQSFTIFNVGGGNPIGFFDNAGDNQRVDTVGGEGSFLVRYGVTSPNPTQIILSEFEPSFILGDINGDGIVSLLDVAPFVALLTSGEFNPAADINQDGVVSLLDVAPFVSLLTG